MKTIFLLLFIGLSGCAGAGFKETYYQPTKGGTVWAKNGMFSAEKSYKKAQELMNDFCPGGYEIKSESYNDKLVGVSYGYGQVTPETSPFRYTNFVCK